MKIKKTTNGKKGGNVGGKKHSQGGVKAVIVDSERPVEIESGEVIINAKSVKKHWRELDKINRSEGGVSIHAPVDEIAKNGGKIDDNSEKNRNFTSTNITKDEIQNVISGKSKVSYSDAIEAASNYIGNCESKNSEASKGTSKYREEEARSLKKYALENKLLIPYPKEEPFNSGYEQSVYLLNKTHVIKLNNSIFYTCWRDYFNSLLLHNLFFPDTAYELIGFSEKDNKIYSVVKQRFVDWDRKATIEEIQKFMHENDFVYMRKNNYKNFELELLIEDLHDENVYVKNDLLYFVDTIFFLQPEQKKLGGNISEDFDDSIFYKKECDCKHEHIEKKEFGGGFDDYIEEFEEQNPIDSTPTIVTETMELGRELIQKDYINEIKKIVKIKKFTSDIKELNLYKLGWRFQFGSSRQWAGLCSIEPKDQMKSKDKNIYVSIQFVKHDNAWKTEMRDVIYHEIAHALVLEIFHFNQANKNKLHALDDLDKVSKGHGMIWKAVSKAISGKELRIHYENADKKDSFKPFMYECPNCEHIGYGDYFKFTDSCDNCNSSVLTQANII